MVHRMNNARNTLEIRARPIILAAAFVFMLHRPSAMAQIKADLPQLDSQVESIGQKVGVTEFQTQQIEIVADAAGKASAMVDLMGRSVVLELTPFSLRAHNFQVLAAGENGILTAIAAPAPSTYRGRIAGDKGAGSGIAASIIDGRLTAEIIDGHSGWWIQPLDQLVPGADRHAHVIFQQQDLIPRDFKCGTDTSKIKPIELGGIATGAEAGARGEWGASARPRSPLMPIMSISSSFEGSPINWPPPPRTLKWS